MAEAKDKKEVAPKKNKAQASTKTAKVSQPAASKDVKAPNVEKVSKAPAAKVQKPTKKEANTPKAASVKAEKKEKKFDGKKITIKQIVSGGGRKKDQIKTLIGLGLNKLNKTVELEDTQSMRGMVNKVSHLIKIVNQ